MIWVLCIADLLCGPVRALKGGRVEKVVAAGGNGILVSGRWGHMVSVEVYDIASNTWETGRFFLRRMRM